MLAAVASRLRSERGIVWVDLGAGQEGQGIVSMARWKLGGLAVGLFGGWDLVGLWQLGDPTILMIMLLLLLALILILVLIELQ